MSGSTSERIAVVTASARSLPALIYPIEETVVGNITWTCPASRSLNAGELVVECRIDRVTTDQEKRVAVCGRAHDRLGADIAAATRPVVDNKLLAEPLR